MTQIPREASLPLSFSLTADCTDVREGLAPSEALPNPPLRQRILFMYIGMLTIAGWNFFLTTIGFYELWFPGRQWAFISSMFCQGMNLFGTSCMVVAGGRVPFRVGYCGGLIAMIIPCVAAPMLAFWSDHAVWGFWTCVALVALLGIGNAVFTSLVVGAAGAIHSQLVGAVMAGQGVIGVIAPVLMISFKLISGDPMRYKYEVVFSYYGIAAVMLAVGLVLVTLIPIRENTTNTTITSSEKTTGSVVFEARRQVLNVFGTFAITFLIFPGVAATWKPQLAFFINMGEVGPDWYTTLIVGVFQVFDVISRMTPQFPMRLGISERVLRAPVLLRIVFVPIFIVLQRVPSLFQSPAQSYVEIIVMALFALTNGWCSTLAMIYGPGQVPGEEERVGAAMVLALIGGIFVGSLFALLTQIGA